MRAGRSTTGRLRRAAQLVALAATNGYWKILATGQTYQGPLKSVCLPLLSCHACPTAVTACPVGTVQHFAAVHRFPLLLLGLFGLFGMLVGRMACGWLCPFGLLQDLLHRLPTGKIRLPRALGVTRYFILTLLVVLIPYATGLHAFSNLCPLGTLTAAVPWTLYNPIDAATLQPVAAGALGWLTVLKVALLGLFIWLFIVAKRPFCRIVCPVGLFLSFFNRFSWLRLRVSEGCTRCGRCADLCPVDLRIYEEPDSGECIRCLACTSCPHVTVTVRAPRPVELPRAAAAVSLTSETGSEEVHIVR